jgi:hypothetical protein
MIARSVKPGAAVALALLAGAGCAPKPAAPKLAPAQAAMRDAFIAAFGRPPPWATLDEGGDQVTYRPQGLVDLSPGVTALISVGELPADCKLCAGALTIDYLRRDGAGFSRLGHWPAFAGQGDHGRALPWTVRADLDDGPTLVISNAQHETGCSSTLQDLVTLTPKGPVKIATVVTAMAIEAIPGRQQAGDNVTATITPIVRGQSFAVKVSGTLSLRQVYRRQGDVFTAYGAGLTGC